MGRGNLLHEANLLKPGEITALSNAQALTQRVKKNRESGKIENQNTGTR